MGKQLLKDADILDFLDTDILGLATNPERPFDFVTSEVRTQQAHLLTPQVEEILTLLGGFESTVFETRAMPRMPPKHQLDMDITETLDARPVAMRHYPVATQHMPGLERQIKARCGYYSRKQEFVRISRFVCPKKDSKLRLCVDYWRLDRQTLWDCCPTPVAPDHRAISRFAHV